MTLKELLKILRFFNFKTVYFNFKYLPFKQAIKMPIFITWRTLLNRTKGKVIIHSEKIEPGMIRIGHARVGLFDKRTYKAVWEVEGEVNFIGGALIKYGAKIIVPKGAILNIGDKFRLTTNSFIICYKKISFGSNVIISWETTIMDTDFHKIMDLDGKVINSPREISIGDNVWIGTRVTILKGTRVENNNIIASNSLLNRPIEGSFQIIAGNPARVVRRDITWHE
jgi:acetyltransferase-like isoleucine patch superfamily enzyme